MKGKVFHAVMHSSIQLSRFENVTSRNYMDHMTTFRRMDPLSPWKFTTSFFGNFYVMAAHVTIPAVTDVFC